MCTRTHTLSHEYKSEKNGLRDKMLQEIEDRRKRLHTDRDTLTIDNDTLIETTAHQRSAIPRTLRRNRGDTNAAAGDGANEPAETGRGARGRRNQQPTGPSVALALKEDEILEDLFLLSKVDTQVRARGLCRCAH